MSLSFSVSKDEEHVEVAIIYAGGVIQLPPRRNAYVLLTLARNRLDDRARGGIPAPDEGWVYANELVQQLGCETEQRLNLDIFRIREQFSKVGRGRSRHRRAPAADPTAPDRREGSGHRERMSALAQKRLSPANAVPLGIAL